MMLCLQRLPPLQPYYDVMRASLSWPRPAMQFLIWSLFRPATSNSVRLGSHLKSFFSITKQDLKNIVSCGLALSLIA